MEKTKFSEDLLEPLSQSLRSIILLTLARFIGRGSSDYTDHSNQEEEQSHEKCRHPGGEREGVAVNEEVEISDLK